ncbi:MAG: SPOR domain-containing protein [Microscillaceae bacterium]|nr:SPOR domain-containing protein [Microscillaceae bacterium]
MKKLILFALMFVLSINVMLAQGNKKDKKPKRDKKSEKALKDEMKEYYYEIEKFEKVKYEMGKAVERADSLDKVLAELKKNQNDNREAIDRLALEREQNQTRLRELESKKSDSTMRSAIPTEGVFFTVQIGAYNRVNLSHLLDTSSSDLTVEEDSGTKKYLLGGYRSYEDAANARKKIRQMGVKDAWIVSYKDGRRVPMTEVRNTPIPDEELKELETIKKQ